MAYYFSINNGDSEYAATSNTTSANKDVEIVINTNANVPSVEELLLAIEKLENFIIRSGKAWS